jgi:hypothetical protein
MACALAGVAKTVPSPIVMVCSRKTLLSVDTFFIMMLSFGKNPVATGGLKVEKPKKIFSAAWDEKSEIFHIQNLANSACPAIGPSGPGISSPAVVPKGEQRQQRRRQLSHQA